MSQINTAPATRQALEDERRRSAVECVRRLLRSYYTTSVDDDTRLRLESALASLERDWPHLILVVRAHSSGEDFLSLARTWGISKTTVTEEWRDGTVRLAHLLGYLPN